MDSSNKSDNEMMAVVHASEPKESPDDIGAKMSILEHEVKVEHHDKEG